MPFTRSHIDIMPGISSKRQKKISKEAVFLTALLLSICFTHIQASAANEIKLSLQNCPQTEIYLGYYLGGEQYLLDTIQVDEEGNGSIKSDLKWEEGLYFIMLRKNKSFDLIINDDQKFKLEAEYTDISSTMKVSGHVENEQLYEILRLNKEISRLKKQTPSSLDSLSGRAELKELNDQLDKVRGRVLASGDNSLLRSIILINTEPEIPDSIVEEDGGVSKNHQFAYYKEHFWDNTLFEDSRLIRTPYFHLRLERYIDDLFPKSWKGRLQATDSIMAIVGKHPAFFKYSFQYLSKRFHEAEMMGEEAVFVLLADKYLNDSSVFWMSNVEKIRMRSRAEEMSLSLLEKPAPNLILEDRQGKEKALIEGDADYFLLLFYNPGCAKCKSQAPGYAKAFRNIDDSLKVKIICVSTEGSQAEWEKFILEKGFSEFENLRDPKGPGRLRIKYDVYKVPKLFILNNERIISAKQLKADQVSAFFEFESKRKQRGNSTNE